MVSIEGNDYSYMTDADLSTDQFKAVCLVAGYVALMDDSGDYVCLGVLQDNPNGSAQEVACVVREAGHAKCHVDDSAILAGSPLKIDDAGVLTLATLGGSDVILGIACEPNSSTACIIEVVLTARQA